MKTTEIVNNVSRTFHKVGFKLRKHSPEILVVAGVIGTVTSAVMACKATTKVSAILEEAKTQVDAVHEISNNPELVEAHQYTEDVQKKDLAIVYTQTGLKLAKLYGPSVVLGVASIGAILGGHNILHKRSVALAAAYATVEKGFKEYRGRVIERFGKDLDRELKYNIKAKEIEEVVTNEDGTETTVTKTVPTADPNLNSDYARFFDDGCKGWDKNAEYNLMTLKAVQTQATDKLRAQGFLFLNDVYEMLGIPKTKAGQVVGWIYDKSENPIGDNYVDFGLYDQNNEKARDFVNGRERVFLLEFNVDGNIWKLMN